MTITAGHALVTGSSRGIGRGIALKLADGGMSLMDSALPLAVEQPELQPA